MANLDPTGKLREGVSAETSRFVVNLLFAVVAALIGAIYWNMNEKINDKINVLGAQISEVRADSRIVQKDTYDLRLSIQDLKSRLTTLVETLNTREEQRWTGKK